MLAYTRNNAPDPGEGFEGIHTLVRGKTLGGQVSIQFASWNVGTLSRKAGEFAETLKSVVSILVVYRKLDGKKSDWEQV